MRAAARTTFGAAPRSGFGGAARAAHAARSGPTRAGPPTPRPPLAAARRAAPGPFAPPLPARLRLRGGGAAAAPQNPKANAVRPPRVGGRPAPRKRSQQEKGAVPKKPLRGGHSGGILAPCVRGALAAARFVGEPVSGSPTSSGCGGCPPPPLRGNGNGPGSRRRVRVPRTRLVQRPLVKPPRQAPMPTHGRERRTSHSSLHTRHYQ